MRLLASLVALGLPIAASAQSRPSGVLLRPGIDSLAVFMVRGADTARTGTVVDELSIDVEGSRRVWRRVYRSSDRILGNRLDTLVDDQATLRPVRHASRSSRSVELLSFGPQRVKGWMRLPNGDSVTVDVPLTGDAYNSSTVDLVLRASPLSDGWETTVSMFLPNTRTSVPLTARVRGSDTVDGIATWRVDADFTGMPVTFWIAKDSRQLVRQAMHIRPDVTILFTKASAGLGKRAT